MRLQVSFFAFSICCNVCFGFLARDSQLLRDNIPDLFCERFGHNSARTWHHKDLIEEALKEFSKLCLQDASLDKTELSLEESFETCLHDPATRSSFAIATKDIINHVENGDEGPSGLEPKYHFWNEEFEDAQNVLSERWSETIDAIFSGDFDEARLLLGLSLNAIQDFYSQTNWIELKNNKILECLGLPICIINNLATPTEKTCKQEREYYSWGSDNPLGNLILEGKLTSAFISTNHVSTTHFEGKCNHGGLSPLGHPFEGQSGINKDTATKCFSPQFSFHQDAAHLAVNATTHYLNALLNSVGEKNFKKLIGVANYLTKLIVLDVGATTKTVRENLIDFIKKFRHNDNIQFAVVPFASNEIGDAYQVQNFSDLENLLVSLPFVEHQGPSMALSAMHSGMERIPTSSEVILLANSPIMDLGISSLVEKLANVRNLKVTAILIEPEDNSTQGEKKVLAELSLNTGMQAAFFTKKTFAQKGAFMHDLLNGTGMERTIIMRHMTNLSSFSSLTFPIDNSVETFSVGISGQVATYTLTDPQGNEIEISEENKDSNIQFISIQKDFVKVRFTLKGNENKAFFGMWRLELEAMERCSILVSASTSMDIFPSFYWTDSTAIQPSIRKFDGLPLKNKTDYLYIYVNGWNILGSLESVAFAETANIHKEILTFTNWTIQNRNEYYVKVPLGDQLLSQEFFIIAKGTDSDGNEFRREHSSVWWFTEQEVSPNPPSLPPTERLDFSSDEAIFDYSDFNATGNEVYASLRAAPLEINELENPRTPRVSGRQSNDIVAPSVQLIDETSCSGYLLRTECDDRIWSARIYISDYGSGLYDVHTDPESNIPYIRPGTPAIQLVYTAKCCKPDVTIYAVDIAQNTETLDISVGDLEFSIWAIVLMALACIVGVSLIIGLIVYCFRRRSKKRNDSVTLTRRGSR